MEAEERNGIEMIQVEIEATVAVIEANDEGIKKI
jgi:hypothetical protein